MRAVVYGPGGFDSSKPNNNVLSETEVPETDGQVAERTLGDRIDANLDRLRDGIASFDTDTAAARWATVKLALRVVLALARLVRGRTEVDG